MTDPMFTPESGRELLVVLPDRPSADAARAALVAAGLDEREVHVDEELDAVASRRAEMHDELSGPRDVPHLGLAHPTEAERVVMGVTAMGILLGVAVAFPFALIDIGGTYWSRWVVFAIVGVAFGLAIALAIGPARAAHPWQLPAAARGTLLRVERDTPAVREVLARFESVRVDEISHDGDPIGTLARERHRATGRSPRG